MKNGEESTFARWGRSIANAFKTATKKEVEKHEPGPSINPEALTAQKREWIDSQAAQVQLSLATWPEHLFEHFFVIGLPPDIEVTQIAEDLWAQEVRQQRQDGGNEQHSAAAATGSSSGIGGAHVGGSGRMSGAGRHQAAAGAAAAAHQKQQQYDKAPRPAYDALVLFRHPPSKAAPLSDQELVDLCFPHKVAPVKLRRSPSMSSLHEVVYGRHAAARDEQCFIFLLKVGTSLPLYGICCVVPEVLHRPPHLARHLYPSCRMPFRSVMIAAPRVYCLLSHYPFFDLHFQVLNVILGMERLHRTIDFNAELDAGAAVAVAPAGPTAAAAAGTSGGMASGSTAATTDKAGSQQHKPPHQHYHPHQQQRPGQPDGSAHHPGQQQVAQLQAARQQAAQQHHHHHQQRDGVRLRSRCYCHDCAAAIAEMYPGLLQPPRDADSALFRHSRSGQHLAEHPQVAPAAAAVPPVRGGSGFPPIRTHGLVRRLSDPGSSGLPSPRAGLGTIASADEAAGAELWQGYGIPSSGGAATAVGAGVPMTAVEGVQPLCGTPQAGRVSLECCQACGRVLGLGTSSRCTQEMPTVAELGVLEEATDALESTMDKLVALPRAFAASVTGVVSEAAAAAAVVLRRVSPGSGATSRANPPGSGIGRPVGNGDVDDGVSAAAAPGAADGGRLPYPRSDSYLSSDMGTPRGAMPTGASLSTRALVAVPAEAVSTLAYKVRDSLKAIGSGAIGGAGGGSRQGRSVEGSGDAAAAADGRSAAATAPAAVAAEQPPDGLHIRRGGPDQGGAFIAVNTPSPLPMRKSAFSLTDSGNDNVAAPPPLVPRSSAVPLSGDLDSAVQSLGADPRAFSLVQQLMRSVMAPVSPTQVAATLAASESYAAAGPGLPSTSPPESSGAAAGGVHSAVQSPQLPSSPRQQDASSSFSSSAAAAAPPPRPPRPHPRPHQRQRSTGSAAAPRAPPDSPAEAASGPGAGPPHLSGWSFLQHHLRPRRTGQPHSPLQERCGSECSLTPVRQSVGQAGISERPGSSAGGGRSGGGSVGVVGVSSAFATAVDMAAEVEQQISLPKTPLVYDAVVVPAAAAAAAALQSPEDGGCPAAMQYGGAAGSCSSGGGGAVLQPPSPPPRPPMPPPRLTSCSGDSASHYASFPASDPASRRMTAQSRDSGGGGEADGTLALASRLQMPSAPLTVTARLIAEHSGFSAGPSDGSFYTAAEFADEDITPLDDADTEPAAAAEAAGAFAPSPFQAVGAAFAAAAASDPPSDSDRASGAAMAGRPSVGASRPLLYGSGGGGGTASSGQGLLPTATTAPVNGPSRVDRTSASFALRLGASADAAAAFSPPMASLGVTAAVTAAAALAARGWRSGGSCSAGGATAGCQPPLATVDSQQVSGGMASPPPAGVAITHDMAHHFSPRRALDQLYEHPLVHPGEQMTLRFGGVTTLSYTRPVLARRFTVVGHPRAIQSYAEAELAEGLQHWTTAVLCRSLSLEHLLHVLTAVLLERQVVVFCPAIAVLSGCVLGLLPLLRPFAWQSLLLPVTPASMMGFLEAPVPFVLGVQYKTSDVMARCSHLIRVNVYKDQVKNAGAPLPQLPGLKRLAAALVPHHAVLRRRLVHQPGSGGPAGGGKGGGGRGGEGSAAAAVASGGLSALLSGAAVPGVPLDGGRSLRSLSPAELTAASSFLAILSQHLTSMCGDLRPHVITNVGLAKRTGVLMKESLLEVVPLKDKPFVRQFVETQMFAAWSDAIISADVEGSFAAA